MQQDIHHRGASRTHSAALSISAGPRRYAHRLGISEAAMRRALALAREDLAREIEAAHAEWGTTPPYRSWEGAP